MAEFTIGDYDYRSTKLNALEQERVARRLAPALPALSGYQAAAREGLESEAGQDFIKMAGQAINAIDDDKALFIYATCCSKCQRRRVGDTGSWSPVWNLGAGRPQHEDINFVSMLRITTEVIKAELSDFFPASL